jgi:hypothetical protein
MAGNADDVMLEALAAALAPRILKLIRDELAADAAISENDRGVQVLRSLGFGVGDLPPTGELAPSRARGPRKKAR